MSEREVRRLLGECGLDRYATVMVEGSKIRVIINYDPLIEDKRRTLTLARRINGGRFAGIKAEELIEQLHMLTKNMEDVAVREEITVQRSRSGLNRLRRFLGIVRERINDVDRKAKGMRSLVRQVHFYAYELLRSSR